LAAKHTAIKEEISAIEKLVISLLYIMQPDLSASNFGRIRRILMGKHEKEVQKKSKSNVKPYIGWTASLQLSMGIAWQYALLEIAKNAATNAKIKSKPLKRI
jgi:hypothetical protein